MPTTGKLNTYYIADIKGYDLPGSQFEIYTFEAFMQDVEHLREPHRHNFFALLVPATGKAVHSIDFSEYEIIPRRIFLINYGQVHAWHHAGSLSGYVILFTKEFYNVIFTGNKKIRSDELLNNFPPFTDITEDEFNDWQQTLSLMQREKENGLPNSTEIICMLLKSCIMRYTRSSGHVTRPKAARKENIYAEFKNLVQEHYKKLKAPKDYALLMHLTPNYLNAVVKKASGSSATDHIRNRVVLEAKRMLTHSDLTVTQIGEELGFSDKSHFGKYFKRSEKIAPDSYRKKASMPYMPEHVA